jgi:hypothetical protein
MGGSHEKNSGTHGAAGTRHPLSFNPLLTTTQTYSLRQQYRSNLPRKILGNISVCYFQKWESAS